MGNPPSKNRSRKPRAPSSPPKDQRAIDDAVVHHSEAHKGVYKMLNRFNQKFPTLELPLISTSNHLGGRASHGRPSAVRQTEHEELREPGLSPTSQVNPTLPPKSVDSARAGRSSRPSLERTALPVKAVPPQQIETKQADECKIVLLPGVVAATN